MANPSYPSLSRSVLESNLDKSLPSIGGLFRSPTGYPLVSPDVPSSSYSVSPNLNEASSRRPSDQPSFRPPPHLDQPSLGDYRDPYSDRYGSQSHLNGNGYSSMVDGNAEAGPSSSSSRGNGNGDMDMDVKMEGGTSVTGSQEEAPRKRKKRRVVAYTCEQCTKRKQKCNKEIPCQHCIARGIGDQCVLYVPPGLYDPPEPNSRSKRKRKKEEPLPSTPTSATHPHPPTSATSDPSNQPFPSPVSARTNGVAGLSYSDYSGGMQHPLDHSIASHTLNSAISSSESPSMSHQQHMMSPHSHPTPNGRGSTSEPAEAHLHPHGSGSNGVGPNGAVDEEKTFRVEMIRRMQRLEEMLSKKSSGLTSDWFSDTLSPMDPAVLGQYFARTAGDDDGPGSGGGGGPNGKAPQGAEAGGSGGAGNASNTAPPAIGAVLKRLIKSTGIAPSTVFELVADLPSYTFARSLVDRFFKFINPLRYPIHEAGFREAFEDMYLKKEKENGMPDPGNVRNLPLIFIVLATSVMTAPEEIAGDERARKMASLRMYWSSRRSALIAASIQPESLELVITGLLSAMYLILVHDRRLTEAWSQLGSSLRTAQAIGCHRDGSKIGLDPIQTEYRRRVWCYLYHADRHYSLILGRPPSIRESYYDVQEPANLDWDDIVPGQPIVSKPLNEPTTATFMLLRGRFAKLTGKIAHHFQKLNQQATYSEVEALDEELNTFIEDLPPHFRSVEPDTSLDQKVMHLPLQRFALGTEVQFTRIILHRPWLLRKFWNDKYQLSRQACFDAAKTDFKIRQAFRKTQEYKGSNTYKGQFREFNSAMIAGIAAIIAPNGPDADQMRLILTTFLDRHPADKQGTKDFTSQKEVAIIYTLYRRSLQVTENLDSGAIRNEPQDPVSLLLGLRDGEARPPPGNLSVSAGVDPNDASFYSQPAFGEEASTAVMVRDIYATMVKKGMVAKPSGGCRKEKPAPVAEDEKPAEAMVTTPEVASTSSQHQDGVAKMPTPGLLFSLDGDEDPQQLFNSWLSANAGLGASNNMPSTGFGDFGSSIDPFEGLTDIGLYGDPSFSALSGWETTLHSGLGFGAAPTPQAPPPPIFQDTTGGLVGFGQGGEFPPRRQMYGGPGGGVWGGASGSS